jgi:hypothetical protein
MPQRLRLKSTLVITASLAVGLSAAGCGSSSSSTTTTTTPAITKSAFLAKANAICTQGDAAIGAVAAKLGKNPTQTQIVAFVTKTEVPAIQAQITAIRVLGAPSADQATVTNFLNLAQADLNKVKANPALIAAKASPFHDFALVAHSYGLTACARTA